MSAWLRRVAILAVCGVVVSGASSVRPSAAGGQGSAPTLTSHVVPVYPPIARSARVQGEVALEVTIDTDGSVRDARVVRSISLLDQAAIVAVRQWRFVPADLPRVVPVTVAFRLTDSMLMPAGAPPAERRPSVAPDFAFKLVVNCEAGVAHIDSSSGVISTASRVSASETRQFTLAPADEERLYRALDEANVFSVASSVVESDTLVVSSTGIRTTVIGEVPVISVVSTHTPVRRSHTQRLVTRRQGDVRVATWEEPVGASDPWAQRLASVSRLIRELVSGGATVC